MEVLHTLDLRVNGRQLALVVRDSLVLHQPFKMAKLLFALLFRAVCDEDFSGLRHLVDRRDLLHAVRGVVKVHLEHLDLVFESYFVKLPLRVHLFHHFFVHLFLAILGGNFFGGVFPDAAGQFGGALHLLVNLLDLVMESLGLHYLGHLLDPGLAVSACELAFE